MKQVFQSLDDGTTQVVDVPAPQVSSGHVLIRTGASIVSAGTERMLVDFGNANLVQKARQQPERVGQVLDKVRTDGLATTIHAVRSKLGRPIPLGYANAGVVLAVGEGVDDLAVGDQVVSNGPHAQVVSVPRNLVAPVPSRPDGSRLSAEEAAFASIGSIALQGVRLAQPTIGERFVVIGLGLIGLLTLQVLRANGCRVLGLDVDASRVELARGFGADGYVVGGGTDPVAAADVFADGRGVDGVIVAASTKSNEPVRQAAKMCRVRGRIIMVGVTGMDLVREDLYAKEVSFQVSCSYGPGRYDPSYEAKGHDYPFGFVRWTAARNFESFAQLVADGQVDVASLVTHRRPIDEAAAAYDDLSSNRSVLGMALTYPDAEVEEDDRLLVRTVTTDHAAPRPLTGAPRVAVIGAGNYTQQVLLPAIVASGAVLDTVVSRGGASAAQGAREFGFARASTDVESVLTNDAIDAVFITTRHDTHAHLTVRALDVGKSVYCEKPLALTHAELDDVEAAWERAQDHPNRPQLTVGFNRRYAPLTTELTGLLATTSGPRTVQITVNAGAIPADHWVHDPDVGGGRIIGEGVHFIDLAAHLIGSPITSSHAVSLGVSPADSQVLSLEFEDGSMASILYVSTGHPRFTKERVEVFVDGNVATIDNWRNLETQGWTRPRSWLPGGGGQEKGHVQSVASFIEKVRAGQSAEGGRELIALHRTAVALAARTA